MKNIILSLFVLTLLVSCSSKEDDIIEKVNNNGIEMTYNIPIISPDKEIIEKYLKSIDKNYDSFESPNQLLLRANLYKNNKSLFKSVEYVFFYNNNVVNGVSINFEYSVKLSDDLQDRILTELSDLIFL